MDGNNIVQKKKMFLQGKNFLFYYVVFFFLVNTRTPSFVFVGGGWEEGLCPMDSNTQFHTSVVHERGAHSANHSDYATKCFYYVSITFVVIFIYQYWANLFVGQILG